MKRRKEVQEVERSYRRRTSIQNFSMFSTPHSSIGSKGGEARGRGEAGE